MTPTMETEAPAEIGAVENEPRTIRDLAREVIEKLARGEGVSVFEKAQVRDWLGEEKFTLNLDNARKAYRCHVAINAAREARAATPNYLAEMNAAQDELRAFDAEAEKQRNELLAKVRAVSEKKRAATAKLDVVAQREREGYRTLEQLNRHVNKRIDAMANKLGEVSVRIADLNQVREIAGRNQSAARTASYEAALSRKTAFGIGERETLQKQLSQAQVESVNAEKAVAVIPQLIDECNQIQAEIKRLQDSKLDWRNVIVIESEFGD
jgi:predicted transcriptional regulator